MQLVIKPPFSNLVLFIKHIHFSLRKQVSKHVSLCKNTCPSLSSSTCARRTAIKSRSTAALLRCYEAKDATTPTLISACFMIISSHFLTVGIRQLQPVSTSKWLQKTSQYLAISYFASLLCCTQVKLCDSADECHWWLLCVWS